MLSKELRDVVDENTYSKSQLELFRRQTYVPSRSEKFDRLDQVKLPFVV